MALSYKDYIADGQTKDFPIPFKSLHDDDIKVFVDGQRQDRSINNKVVSLLVPPAADVVVRVKRETPLHERAIDFTDGGILSEKNLDQANEQLFYIAQEVLDYSEGLLKMHDDGQFSALNRRMREVADPVEANDAVNLGYMNAQYIPAARAEADRARSERETTSGIREDTAAIRDNTASIHTSAVADTKAIYNQTGTVKTQTEQIKSQAEQHRNTANAYKDKAIEEASKAETEANRAHGEANRAKGYVDQYKPEVKGSWVFSDYRTYAVDGRGAGEACIYNDASTYKALMLLGNDSAGGLRKVKLYDELDVHKGITAHGGHKVYDTSSIKISSGNPSGGAHGHIWFKYS